MLNQITEGKGDIYISMNYDIITQFYDDELNIRTIDEMCEIIQSDSLSFDLAASNGNHVFIDYARNVISDKVKLYNIDLDQYIRDHIDCEYEPLRMICIQIVDGPKTNFKMCLGKGEIIGKETIIFLDKLSRNFNTQLLDSF